MRVWCEPVQTSDNPAGKVLLDTEDELYDQSLTFHWRATHPGLLAARLRILATQNLRVAQAREQILMNAVFAHYSGAPGVHYPRRPAAYTGMLRYQGSAYSFHIVPPTVDELARMGWLENRIAPSCAEGGVESSFSASPALAGAIPIAALSGIWHRPRELIRLRQTDKRTVAYRDTEETRR